MKQTVWFVALLAIVAAVPLVSPVHAGELIMWATKAPMPTARYGAACGQVSGKLYVCGGYNTPSQNGPTLSVVERYDPSTDSWATLTPMPYGLGVSGAAVANDRVYVAGGVRDWSGLWQSTLFEYDPAADQWTEKASMPTPRYGVACAAVGGKLFAIGGYSNYQCVNTCEMYDPATNSWTTRASMPTGRYFLGCAVVNGLIYAIGGGNGSGLLGVSEVYDPVADTWGTKAAMPTARYGLGCCACDNRIIAVGGFNGLELATVEVYDAASNTWTSDNNLPTARFGLVASAVNGVAYAIGGLRGDYDYLATNEASTGIEPSAYVVLPISPDPNPDVSDVMQGGAFHRYYLVADTFGRAAPGQTVSAYWASTPGSFVSGDDGVVDVHFETDSHQPGEVLSGGATQVGGHAIDTVPFTAEVLARRYDRTLEFDGEMEGGLGVIEGLDFMLDSPKRVTLSGTSTSPDSLRIESRWEAGLSHGPSLTAGVELSVNDVNLGVVASGNMYAGGALFAEGGYLFPNPVPDSGYLDAAALLLILDPTGLLTLSGALAPVGQYLAEQYCAPLLGCLDGGAAGVDIFGGAEGRAAVGLTRSDLRTGQIGGVGVQEGVGGHLHSSLSFETRPAGVVGAKMLVGGEIHGYRSLDLNLDPTPLNGEQAKDMMADMGIYNWRDTGYRFLFDGSLECGFVVLADMAGPTSMVTFLSKQQGNNTEVYEYEISSETQGLMAEFVNDLAPGLIADAVGLLSVGRSVAALTVSPETYARSFYAVMDKVDSFMQSGRDLEMVYRKYNANAVDVVPIRISVNVGLKDVEGSIGIDRSIRNEKELLAEEGVVTRSGTYPLKTYSDDAYTAERSDVNSVPGGLAGQVISGLIDYIFTVAKGMMPGTELSDSLVLAVRTGTLVLRPGVLPPGDSAALVAWSWMPETSAQSAARSVRLYLQSRVHLAYGVGGFYLVQPETVLADGLASLRIAYADSEVAGLDESALRMYRWDDSLRKWLLAGGAPHPESNYVYLDSMERFGLYTLAPAAPTDTFALAAMPDSVYADGTSTTGVTGGPVQMNTGGPVPNGTLVTVASSVGTITTPDADTLEPGVQVATADGEFSFTLQSPTLATHSTIVARSVDGDAAGMCQVVFYDTVPPSAPESLSVRALDSMRIRVTWRRPGDADVLGYRVYYGTDSMPPYDGVSEFDVASPADVGADTMRVLALPLWLDSTYYVCATAVDGSGWESPYSNVRAAPTGACIAGRTTHYSNAKPVADVQLVLAGSGADTANTDANGNYVLAAVPWYQDYSVTPSRTESRRSPAVTSYDAALVLRHAVHQDTLDSLQVTAGNVSGDTTVSAYDAALILQYAVGRIGHFPVGAQPGGDSVDWAFQPPTRAYDSLSANQTGQDYAGVLYGDPSGNWPGTDMPSSRDHVPDGGPCAYYKLNMPRGGSANDQAPMPSQGPRQNAQEPAPMTASGELKTIGPELSAGRGLEAAPATGTVRREPSAEFVFQVKANRARNAVSADILVRYDAGRFALRGIRTTEQTEGFMVAAADRGGYVRIGMAGTRGFNGDAELLELLFEPCPSPFSSSQRAEDVGEEAVGGELSTVGAEVLWLVLNEGASDVADRTGEGAMGDKRNLPKQFSLSQPRPNPFGTGTSISYDLPFPSAVKLAVFDATGRMVRILANGKIAAGSYAVTWNGKDNAGKRLANGIYFVRMETDRLSFERKATLVRE